MRCSRAGLDTRRPLGHLLQLRASPGSATLRGGQEAVQTELLCGLRGAGTGTPHSLTACPSALPPLPLSTRHHLPGPPGSASWERGGYSRLGCPVSSRRGPAHITQLGSLELPHGDRVTGGGWRWGAVGVQGTIVLSREPTAWSLCQALPAAPRPRPPPLARGGWQLSRAGAWHQHTDAWPPSTGPLAACF